MKSNIEELRKKYMDNPPEGMTVSYTHLDVYKRQALSRFRKRCYDYETLHNKDLYHDCVKELSTSIAKLMGISGKVRRMAVSYTHLEEGDRYCSRLHGYI